MKSILSKTLHEKRWMLLFWTLGVAAMAMLTLSFYSTFRDGSFDEVLKNLPKTVQGLAGNLASNKTIPGFVSQQVFALRIPLLTLVMGIMLFTGLLAGDEGEGTLQTLLTQPVTRTKVFLEKYAAGLIISFIICLGSAIGITIALLILGERLGFWPLIQSVIGVWLLTLVFGTIGYAVGAITGKRSVASGIASLFAFGTYLITSLAPNVSSLGTIQKISPFYYYNNPPTAVSGLDASNVAVMLITILMLLTASIIVFNRRDIYQR
jgi:ABC-2 type transport system permease protein